MSNSGNKMLTMPDYAPLLEAVTTPAAADVLAYFQENPDQDLDAVVLAGKLREDDVKSVREALEDLRSAGVLSSEIKGISQSPHFRLLPDTAVKKAVDRIFSGKETRDSWKEFRDYLVREGGRKRSKKKRLILVGTVVIVLGLGAGIFLLALNSGGSGREREREDLTQFTGIHETRYPNGQVKSRIEYSRGLRAGSFAAWFADGKRMAEGAYRDDRPHGTWRYWNEKGLPLVMIAFEDGRAID